MAKVDFSQLFQTPRVLANTLDHGYKVTDGNWPDEVVQIVPPLFSAGEFLDLKHILDPKIDRRRGQSHPLVAGTTDCPVAESEPARFAR